MLIVPLHGQRAFVRTITVEHARLTQDVPDEHGPAPVWLIPEATRAATDEQNMPHHNDQSYCMREF